MTRALITGAGGFAGSHCLEHLLVNTDWDVVCTDSFKHRGKTDRITQVLDAHPKERSRVQVVTHDLTVPFSQQLEWRIGHCDYVIAYASESHVDRSISDPVPFVTNNVALILNTLEFCRRTRPQTVLVVSTDEVYGPILNEVPFKEWDRIIPSNPYSGSKAAQEAIAISYWRTYDVPVVIVNSMNVIGERQDSEKFVPLIIKAVLEDREVVIHGSKDNIGSRYYMHARNLADAILFLLKRAPARFDREHVDRPDRWNIAPPDRVNNLFLARMIATYIDRPLKYKFEDFPGTRPGHDPHYGLDPGKITSEGWTPPVDFNTSLKRTVEWFLQHPEWL